MSQTLTLEKDDDGQVFYIVQPGHRIPVSEIRALLAGGHLSQQALDACCFDPPRMGNAIYDARQRAVRAPHKKSTSELGGALITVA